jgi:hypothetical protein
MTRLAALGWVCVGLVSLLGCATATEAGREEPPAIAQAAPPEIAPPDPAPLAAPAPQPTAGISLDPSRVLGDVVHVGALSVWPILTDAPLDPGPMSTLAEAQRRYEADVRERGPDAPGLSLAQRIRERRALRERGADAARTGPAVNELVVDNGGRVPLYVPAGTLLRGGQQDRVLAEDVVVAPDTSMFVRVYCVEPGRWTAMRMGTSTEGHFKAVGCVAVSEVRAAGQYERSQSGVWSRVAEVNARSSGDVVAETRAPAASGTLLASVEHAPDAVLQERDDAASAVRREFEALESQGRHVVGFAYAVRGRPVAVRTFANAALFRAQFAAFLRGMAMEAQSAARGAKDAAPPARGEDVVALVRAIESSGERTVEARGTCRNVYVSSPRGWSSSCAVTVDGRDVTLAQDWTAR